MKKIMHEIAVILILLLVIACSSKDDTNGELLEIGNPTTLDDYSDIFSDVEFIFLDSDKDAMLSSAMRTEMVDNRIYTYCLRSQNIYDYSNSGDFIYNTKSSRGRASNEFTVLSDFTVNPTTANLEIYDPGRTQILIFDKEGRYNERIKLPKEFFYSNKFEIIDDDKYIFTGKNRDLTIYNRASSEVKSYTIPDSGFPPNTYSPMSRKIFFRCRDNLYFIPSYDKYIYSVEYDDDIELTIEYTLQLIDNPLKPSYLVGLSSEEVSSFVNSGEILKYSIFNARHITDNYIFVSYIYDEKWYHYIYSRKSGRSICFGDKFRSGNKLPPAHCVTDDSNYAFVAPNYIEQMFPNYKFSDEEATMIGRDAQDANMVLVKFNFNDKIEQSLKL